MGFETPCGGSDEFACLTGSAPFSKTVSTLAFHGESPKRGAKGENVAMGQSETSDRIAGTSTTLIEFNGKNAKC